MTSSLKKRMNEVRRESEKLKSVDKPRSVFFGNGVGDQNQNNRGAVRCKSDKAVAKTKTELKLSLDRART